MTHALSSHHDCRRHRRPHRLTQLHLHPSLADRPCCAGTTHRTWMVRPCRSSHWAKNGGCSLSSRQGRQLWEVEDSNHLRKQLRWPSAVPTYPLCCSWRSAHSHRAEIGDGPHLDRTWEKQSASHLCSCPYLFLCRLQKRPDAWSPSWPSQRQAQRADSLGQ